MNFKKIFSSPITYVAADYPAAEMCQKASDAVTAGRLIPGTIQSDALGMVLIPMMAIGPITGVSLAQRSCLVLRSLGEGVSQTIGRRK